MLTFFEIGHAFPAFLFAYAGFRQLFGHDVGLCIVTIIATLILIATSVHSHLDREHKKTSLAQRIKEQTKEKVTENLQRVKTFDKPSLIDAESFLQGGIRAPEKEFSGHKNTVFVDSASKLEDFVSILCFSQPRFVGVDVEHSKNHSYHGLICLI